MTKKILTTYVNSKAATIEVDQYSFDKKPYLEEYKTCRVVLSAYLDPTTAAKTLMEIQTKYGNVYKRLFICAEVDCDCYHKDEKCYCEAKMFIKGERPETDVEYKFRMKIEEEDKARREEFERREYESLKKKFEK